MARFGVVSVSALLCVGISCGSSPTMPSGVISMAGTWTGTITLAAASGGECLAPTFASGIGTTGPFALSITQQGQQLGAELAPCVFSGRIDASAFSLEATAISCGNAVVRGVRCSDGVSTRDVAEVSQRISGTVNGNQTTMTMVDTTNVLLPGTSQIVGVLMTTRTIQASH